MDVTCLTDRLLTSDVSQGPFPCGLLHDNNSPGLQKPPSPETPKPPKPTEPPINDDGAP
jgi:hypothetical protein